MQYSHDVHENDTWDWLQQIWMLNLMEKKSLKKALDLFDTQDL